MSEGIARKYTTGSFPISGYAAVYLALRNTISGHGGEGLMAGLDGLSGLLQSSPFCVITDVRAHHISTDCQED